MRYGSSLPRLAVAAGLLFAVGPAFAGEQEPCKALPAQQWSKVMGYQATATPGEMNCTYEGKAGGGQFRIMAVVSSAAEAQAGVKRMNTDQWKNSPNGQMGILDSQGKIVFSIALFQENATADTKAQLQQLLAVVKSNLPK